MNAAGEVTEGKTSKELLSAHERLKIVDGTNSLVVNANAKLKAAGRSTEGMTSNELLGAESSRRAKLKMADGTHHLRNLSEESIATQNINMRLTKMKNALPVWKMKMAEFRAEEVKPVGNDYKKDHSWLRNQREKGIHGLRSKAAFEKEHSNKTKWQDNLVQLNNSRSFC